MGDHFPHGRRVPRSDQSGDVSDMQLCGEHYYLKGAMKTCYTDRTWGSKREN